MKLLILLFLLVSSVTLASPLEESRYCGAPQYDSQGRIKRSSATVAAFKRIHPCPSTGLSIGSCSGWEIDHVIPLACGGCDAVSNMQWLPNGLKTAKGKLAKDRWERRIYQLPKPTPGTESFCKLEKL